MDRDELYWRLNTIPSFIIGSHVNELLFKFLSYRRSIVPSRKYIQKNMLPTWHSTLNERDTVHSVGIHVDDLGCVGN